eukprot:CAMPEP_0116836082 /NCGR_PEP_ID=MMETSP0418-20121206/7896_1 /TAXON_ID=1158023 /ORGANISM="Astrosyne radiata, Strain 13vi08-1A" /LENGTH=281 /DNA_ID=CAMNT_0004465807 /DNA_START=242 /DNA_END=1087 /DNA_ORIENTATION=+
MTTTSSQKNAFSPSKVFCILYGVGGTADVGRHAVRAALDAFPGTVRVLTGDPEETLLGQTNWNSACGPHTFTPEERARLDLRTIRPTSKTEDWTEHLDNVGGIVSAMGNRQGFYVGHQYGKVATEKLLKAIMQSQESGVVSRLVAITSVGCNEDWPPMEFHWAGGILKWLFRTLMRTGWRDLEETEKVIRSSDANLNYLIVRPVGLGEERRPKNEWFVQKEKYKDKVGPDMSKMDCARFAVQQVLEPTYENTAVVVGSDWESFTLDEPPASTPVSNSHDET